MNHLFTLKRRVFGSGLILVLGAILCSRGSSGDGNDDEPARVDDMTFEETSVQVGDSVGLDLDFTFANAAIGDNDENVIIKIHVPAGLAYENNSAAIDRLTGDDEVDPEQVIPCGDGRSLLVFDLDENDLTNIDDPAGDADGTLKLRLVGTAAVGSVNVEARAGYDFVAGTCDEPIIPEASQIVRVVL